MKSFLFLLCIIFFSQIALSQDKLSNWEMYYRKSEKEAIESNRSVTRINPKVLQICLKSGKKLKLNDKFENEDDDNQIRYVFKGFDSISISFVVERIFWENADFILINSESGEKTILPGSPIYNEDQTRILSFRSNLLVGTVIEIFKVQEQKLTKEFSFQTEDWLAENFIWKSNYSIEFDKYRMFIDSEGNEVTQKNRNGLTYTSNNWRFE